MHDVNSSKISVEKIGGTSMTAFGDVLRHIMLHNPARIYGRIYVVSAYSGVTNQLLEHKKTGERGIYALFAEGKGYQDALTGLAASLKKLNAAYADIGLPLAVADAFIDQRIAQAREYLGAMHHVLASGYLSRKDVLLAAREVLASIGAPPGMHRHRQAGQRNEPHEDDEQDATQGHVSPAPRPRRFRRCACRRRHAARSDGWNDLPPRAGWKVL